MWKFIIIVFLVIITLGLFFLLIYFWGGKSFGGLELIFPKEDVAEFESIISEEEPSEGQSKEFISPDGKLKLTYSSDWKEINDEKALKEVFTEELTEKYNLKILLFAGYLKSKVFSQLLVAEGYFGDQESLEEIINIFKESGQEKGWEVTIINPELKNNEITFEYVCEKENYSSLHFKEKVILPKQKEDKKTYLIAFVGPDRDWTKMKNRADNIINSVTIID